MRPLRQIAAMIMLLLASCAPEGPRPAAVKPGAADGLTVLTAANFEKEVLLSKQPVLVDVGSPN